MPDWLAQPDVWMALATLIGIELVLAVDNLLFISVVSAQLPPEEQVRARTLGLCLAWVMRVLLLAGVVWLVGTEVPLFSLFGHTLTLEGALLIAGGVFLIGRSTLEIHQRLEGPSGEGVVGVASTSVLGVVLQIGLLDMVFSIDSAVAAVGVTRDLGIMVVAATVAIGAMMLFASRVTAFVNRTPTIRVLALALLLLIGVNLVAEGVGQYIPRGYIYFAMGFALFVEFLNLRAGRHTPPSEGG